MPFSARTRAAITTSIVALSATAALLGAAESATGATAGQARDTAAATVVAGAASMIVTPACGGCWGAN